MKTILQIAVMLTTTIFAVSNAWAQHPPGHGEMKPKPQGAQTANTPYDLHFIDMMIHHHQMGIEMAKLAQNKASHAELKNFATKMAEDQQKDTTQLQQWRDEWYAGQPKPDHMNMAGMSGMKMPQMDMSKLEATSGNQFDLLFIAMIVPHHQMAIDMSQKALKQAQHKQLKTFARTTINKQQKEKTQLSKWRAAWGGKKAATNPDHTKHTTKP